MESIKNKCANKLIEESSLEFLCTTTKRYCNELIQIISSISLFNIPNVIPSNFSYWKRKKYTISYYPKKIYTFVLVGKFSNFDK